MKIIILKLYRHFSFRHVHMNATKWVTLTGFVQYLGTSGKCTVDETEKGYYITWIDRDPETIARQEALNKKGDFFDFKNYVIIY